MSPQTDPGAPSQGLEPFGHTAAGFTRPTDDQGDSEAGLEVDQLVTHGKFLLVGGLMTPTVIRLESEPFQAHA